MKINDFKIGLDFWMSGKQYRCTDVGSRTAAAIYLDPKLDSSWFKGPTYAIVEHVIDEDSIMTCSIDNEL